MSKQLQSKAQDQSADQLQFNFGFGTASLSSGFELKRKPRMMEWVDAWNLVGQYRKLTKWIRGWLYMLIQEGAVSEDAHQFILARDVTLGTVQNEASVVRAYQGHYDFIAKVSFSHHEIVAKLEPARRRYWLQEVIDADFTCKDLREMTAEERETAREKNPEKDGLTRLVKWRDNLEETLYALPEGPWEPDVRQALVHMEQAIEVYRENMGAAVAVPVNGKASISLAA